MRVVVLSRQGAMDLLGRRATLRATGDGSWAVDIFSVVADPADRRINVVYGAAIEERLLAGGGEAACAVEGG